MSGAPGSTTDQLKALAPSIADVLAELRKLAGTQTDRAIGQARMLEQQGILVTKMGQVITQLNKHSLFLVSLERRISRCYNCRNFSPANPLDDTQELGPDPIYPDGLPPPGG